MRCSDIEQCFGIKPGDYDPDNVSPQTDSYNCIAYAMGIQTRKWWPATWLKDDYDWPEHLPRQDQFQETLDNFTQAFELLRYRVCKNPNLVSGIEKVAIYVGPWNNPLHAAIQLESGVWASKCGDFEDIQHKSLQSLEGNTYGKVARYMHRRRDGKPFFWERVRSFFKGPKK